MPAIEHGLDSTGPRHILLWSSCALAIWFPIAWLLYEFVPSLAAPFDMVAMLSGFSSLVGTVLAAAYLCFALWTSVRWRLGLAVLALNVAFLGFYLAVAMNL